MGRALGAVALFTAVINLGYLAPMAYMLQVYDRVMTGRNVTTLVMLSLMVAGFYILIGLLERLRNRILIDVSDRIDERLGQQVFSAAFRRRLNAGEGGVAQSLQHLNELRQFLTGQGLFAFFDAPWAVIYLLTAFFLHPLIGWATLVAMGVLTLFAWATELATRKLLLQGARASSAGMHYAGASLANAEVIQAMGMLGAISQRWLTFQRQAVQYQNQASDRAGLLGAISKTLRLALQSGMLGLGAWLAIHNEISPGAVIAGTFLLGRALAPLEMAIASWRPFLSARQALASLDALLSAYPVPLVEVDLPSPQGEILLDHVDAGPPGQPATLKGVFLHLARGEFLVVMGPSGSGKTTLARILAGVWPTQSGHVRLDGADMYNWPREKVGPAIGYLPQDVELFAGTVGQNIARFGPIDSERVVRAAKAAGVHDLVVRLAQGYETPVGDGGHVLSGGQRQRIGLARALYGDPTLVILDEPNASLDEEGAAALLASLTVLKARGATIVVVSHHTHLVRLSDKIMILREGQVFIAGPRDQVARHIPALARELTS